VDGKIRTGKFKRFHPRLPATLGRDFSGVIERAGSDVTELKEGDEVFGMCDYARGTYAITAWQLPSESRLQAASVGTSPAGCIGWRG